MLSIKIIDDQKSSATGKMVVFWTLAYFVSIFVSSALCGWFLRGHGSKKSEAVNQQARIPPKVSNETKVAPSPAAEKPSPQEGVYHHAILFKPSDGKDQRGLTMYLDLLKKAKTSICIASMTLSGLSICAALRDAAKRGVKVRVIINDFSEKQSRMFSPDELAAANISVRVFRDTTAYRLTLHGDKASEQLFHQKFLVVDEKEMCYGSCNCSEPSFEKHYENLVFTNDKRFILPFRQEFRSRWKEFSS